MKNLLPSLFMAASIVTSAQDRSGGEFHLDKDYRLSSNGTVRLKIGDAKLNVTGSARATAHVKIDRTVVTKGWLLGNEDFSVDVSENNGDLTIRENSRHVGVVGYYSSKYKIDLQLPDGASIYVQGSDGDYFFQSLNGAIQVDADDADIELAQCKGSEFQFKVNDGKISMDQGQGSLRVHGDDSNVTVHNARFSSVDADVNDGNIIIESSLSDGGSYDIRTQDGSVAFTVVSGGGSFDIHHDDGRVTTTGDFGITEKRDGHDRLTLANGSANVNIRTNDGHVRLVRK